ncbi:MAG: metal ABC transporter substrate-binding protein [Actinomycetota bacterium]
MTRAPRVALASILLLAAACSSATGSATGLLVVTTVSPLTDSARNIAGTAARVEGVIPEGVDSHTFEPTTATARLLSQADLIFVNGLHLEDPTLRLAQSNHKSGAAIYELGDHAIDPSRYRYDFSFPKAGGKPNPHLWMDVANAITYAGLIRDQLVARDPAHASVYRQNANGYVALLHRLDVAVATAVKTIPPEDRVLLTYHDSFAYFAAHYGMRVIGAIQPADFSEPSAHEVASLISQIRREHVPAIFGSEVFPSPVLAEIARDTGARYEASLRDDDLPGEPGAPDHSYVGLILFDVRPMVKDLGGDPASLNDIPTMNKYD